MKLKDWIPNSSKIFLSGGDIPTSYSIPDLFDGSYNVDYDVYLPTYNENLQREFCWTLEQKRELIRSMLIGRTIPPIVALFRRGYPNNEVKRIIEIIDGKQRLSTMSDWFNNKFTLPINDTEYYLKDLDEEYQRFFKCYFIKIHRILVETNLTDDEKIELYHFINFAGTPQDKDRMKKFIKK